MSHDENKGSDGPRINVQNHGSGSIEGNSIADQTGTRTYGDHSPVAGRDVYITQASADDGKTTTVELRKRSQSWVTSNRAKWVALAATVVSAAMSVLTVWGPVKWELWTVVRDFETLQHTLEETLPTGLPLILATAASVVLSVRAWKYFAARRRRWPIFPPRGSLRKALIPSETKPGLFYRARPVATCIQCREENRPGVDARLFSIGKQPDGIIGVRCRNGHSGTFRGRSIFGP